MRIENQTDHTFYIGLKDQTENMGFTEIKNGESIAIVAGAIISLPFDKSCIVIKDQP